MHETIVPAMVFYGLTATAWNGLTEQERQRMLGTVSFFQEVSVDSGCRKQIQALASWRDRLAWMEAYIKHRALQEVAAWRGEDLHAVWARVRDFVTAYHDNKNGGGQQPSPASAQAEADHLAPKDTHPLFHEMVELNQRAIHMLHDADWCQEMSPDERNAVQLAVQHAVTTSMYFQVPHSVRMLMKALQPFLRLAQAQDLL